MSKLLEALKQREEISSSLTAKIMEPYETIIENAIQHIFDFNTTSICFESIDLFPSAQDRFVMIIGFVFPEEGEFIRLEGSSPVKITEENKHNYKRVFRVVLPVVDLDEKNYDNIVVSMKNLIDLSTMVEPYEYELILDDPNFDPYDEEFIFNKSLDQLETLQDNIPSEWESPEISNVEETIYGFKLDELTDEQAFQLELNIKKSEKVH